LYNSVGSSDYKASATVLKETMKIILNEDQTQYLPNINVPTLLLWGSLDKDTPISDAKKMEKLIPDCGLVEYPNSTHFSYLQNLNNVNTVLNEFLKNDK
jgi:pimeloyl-ACP methyl ester carboxylesterase